ncbi:unnamed protein product, partial [marine sediment metagenome]
VAKNLPGNQARVRAIKRWVREVFPEAKAKMKEMTATWMDRAGDVRDIQAVIEAEYHIVSEEPPPQLKGKAGAAAPTKQPKARAKATKTETGPTEEKPPEGSIEGEGFTIDLQWLKESQKTLKWTDDTVLTFIIGQYKVSGTSVTGALNKLTREQAEDFTRQINTRLEKQTSLF